MPPATCEGLLSALMEALALQEKDLDERETQLQKERQELDNDRFASYGTTSPIDVLHLNVGSVKTSVLRRTLTSVSRSMLASRFSGRWDESIEKDENGHFFIDQEYSLFRHMLDYLRNKANGGDEDEKYPANSPDIVNENGNWEDLVSRWRSCSSFFRRKKRRVANKSCIESPDLR